MSCPASPEGGFHRYRLPGAGLTLPGRCVYCGAERVFRPFDDAATLWTTASERSAAQSRADAEDTDQ